MLGEPFFSPLKFLTNEQMHTEVRIIFMSTLPMQSHKDNEYDFSSSSNTSQSMGKCRIFVGAKQVNVHRSRYSRFVYKLP